MIKQKKNPILGEVMPHAIFWRPLVYFALSLRSEIDDLDQFDVATFSIGNQFTFDLRKYAGHPPYTVSLYLSVEVRDEQEISDCVDEAVAGFRLPQAAVAWQRGMRFSFGEIARKPEDRLREPEARIIALKIAASYPRRQASMAQIKEKFLRYYELTDIDNQRSPTRRAEKIWQQIVRNIVSHSNSRSSIFSLGLASIEGGVITVSDAGFDYLKSIGFVSVD